MKLSNFRIRDRLNKNKEELLRPKNQEYQTSKLSNFEDSKFASFLQSFENLMNSFVSSHKLPSQSAKKSCKPAKNKRDLDHRDRYVVVDLPEFQDGKVDLNKLEAWIGEVCTESFSVAFHYFIEKKINYEQMRVFASESLLRNLSILVESYKITAQQMRFIDRIMDQKVLPYLKSKYPLTVEKQVNKALQAAVQQIDNSEILTNDYFFSTDIYFEYRASGRYDDVIMRFLNQIMTRIDDKILADDGEDTSNLQMFESIMSGIFEKSFDETWMSSNSSIKQSKAKLTEKQKEKYRETVQGYTQYFINRKVSENTHLFTEDQIKSQYLSIKNSSILRILTKWCEELWAKFQNENYFMERADGIALIKTKKVGLVFPWLKQLLTKNMKQEKQKILEFLKRKEQINYKQQIQLLENQLENADYPYIQRYEKVSGKFACKIVNNIESFIVDYLNRLIHGLTTVSNACFYRMKQYQQYWPSPYNLISFKISDLLRCKYSSKEKEVLKIFRELQKYSQQSQEKLKIIRIKNRLNAATNDILINMRLNNAINCEIQLAVNTVNSEFMYCSNKINHYIYELERAKFGAILQICSIWKTHQKRSQVFEKLIANQKARKQNYVLENSECVKSNVNHELVPEKNPFVCSECSKHYYHNNYIASHLACRKCSYWKCAVCEVEENFKAENKDFFLKHCVQKSNCKFWKKDGNLPQAGICIYIKRPKIQTVIFKKITYNYKDYLVHRTDNKISIMREATSKRQIQDFTSECLIFDFPVSFADKQLQLSKNNSRKELVVNLFIPQIIRKCLKQQNQTISILRQDYLPEVDLKVILNENKQKLKCVKSIEFSSTKLTSLDLISTQFVNLNRLNINLNFVSDISKIGEFRKLQKLYFNDNIIEKLPDSMSNLKLLKELEMYNNKIKEIPENFFNLISLKILNLNNNKIEKIPDNVSQLQNLKEFQIRNNNLKEFPSALLKLKKLQTLNLSQNKINKMPEQFQEFSSLKHLFMNQNQLQNFNVNTAKLDSLLTIQLAKNKISQFPMFLTTTKTLEKLVISSNLIQKIPDQIGNLQKLTTLNVSRNRLSDLNNTIFKLINLNQLRIEYNQIKELEDCFDKLTKLKNLNISSNFLAKLPPSIQQEKLEQFVYLNNPFEQLDLHYAASIINNTLKVTKYTKMKILTCKKPFPMKETITKVSLNTLQLEIFPQAVLSLEKNQILEICNNLISEIPDKFTEQSNLKEVNLTKNRLRLIPSSLQKLQFLKILNLSQNQLTQISDWVCSFSSLTHLLLSRNKLKQIPNSFEDTSNLIQADFSYNDIQVLPDSIGKLKSLKILQAACNKIKQIRLEICRNTSIEFLNLKKNLIQKIPKEINQMKSLLDKSLCLQGNDIKIFEDQIICQQKCDFK